MKRRAFLAAAGTGLTVTFLGGCQALPVVPKRPAPNAAHAQGWVRWEAGRYILCVPRVEMGQQIATALQQIACDELGIGWSELEVRLHGTDTIARVRGTVGSESIQAFALPLAQACATLREALLGGCTSGEQEADERPRSALRSLRADGGGRFVGRAAPLVQGLAIVRGEPLYAADIRPPGLLFGRVLRAPVSPEVESRLVGADDAAALAGAGAVAVVRHRWLALGGSQGLGIVARTPGALDRMAAALAPQWRWDARFEQADIDRAIDIDRRLAGGRALAKTIAGDAVATGAPWDVDLRLDIPLAAHAPIEPRAAVAAPGTGGTLELWVGNQDVFYQRDVVARRLELDDSQVTVHGQRVGGSFGGKTVCTVELEAALLARTVQAPVKVQWTRAQEFQLGFHRPPSSHRLRARLRDGRLVDWWHAFASSHVLFTNAVVPAWMQRFTDLVGDDGVARGAALPYRAAARRTEYDLARLPVFTGPWRGLGAGPNGFAIESAIDECARTVGADPVCFRLDHIEHPRLARVLRRVAELARWDAAHTAAPAGMLRGRGVACGIYKANSYVAVVADVTAHRTSGSVRVERLWCAHDCGFVVNPDQVRAQCEGNLVWGIGMLLGDGLRIASSGIAASTFADAPIPRLSDVPPIDIALVDGGEPPGGAGETAIVAAAAAIANALRDATGVRVVRLPLRPGDLLAGAQPPAGAASAR